MSNSLRFQQDLVVVIVAIVVGFPRGLVPAPNLIRQVVKEDGEKAERVGGLRDATNTTSATRGAHAYTTTAAMLPVRCLNYCRVEDAGIETSGSCLPAEEAVLETPKSALSTPSR